MDLKNAVGSQKQKNKKNPSPGQVSFLSEEVGDLSFDDEEDFLASAFDDDDDADVDFQQETSLNKSAKEDSKPAETGSQKEIRSNALTDKEEADRASKGVDSKAASNTSELVGTEALEKPGLSNKNNNAQVSPAQAGGVSTIEVPELAKKNHILEIVLVSGEATQPNKASKGNDVTNIDDTTQSHEEKDKGNEQLQFSTEDVKVNESAPPSAKDYGVSSDSSAIAVPDTNKTSLTKPVTEINKPPSEDNNTETNNFSNPDAQIDPIKKASAVTPSQNLQADEPSEEITELKESKIPKVGASSPWQFSSVYIPAPSSPSAAPLAYTGKVVVPAVVDQMQEHALEALQALKVSLPHYVFSLSAYILRMVCLLSSLLAFRSFFKIPFVVVLQLKPLLQLILYGRWSPFFVHVGMFYGRPLKVDVRPNPELEAASLEIYSSCTSQLLRLCSESLVF